MLFLLVSPVILGYMTFHIFVYIFSSVVSIVLVLPFLLLVFYLPLSLCFRRRSRHTSLVSFVIFPSFFLALFVFLFWFPALVYARFQRIASKSANLLDVWISITRTTMEEFKDATITGHFGFVVKENSVMEIILLSWCHHFGKAPFSKWFPSTRKSRYFKIPQAWRAFPKSSVFVTD